MPFSSPARGFRVVWDTLFRGREPNRLLRKFFSRAEVFLHAYLKPNVSGNSANNFFSRVLFPEPDGPATTNGRGPCFTMIFEYADGMHLKKNKR